MRSGHIRRKFLCTRRLQIFCRLKESFGPKLHTHQTKNYAKPRQWRKSGAGKARTGSPNSSRYLGVIFPSPQVLHYWHACKWLCCFLYLSRMYFENPLWTACRTYYRIRKLACVWEKDTTFRKAFPPRQGTQENWRHCLLPVTGLSFCILLPL